MCRQLYLLLFLFFSASLFAQGLQTEFGKNRVQYHDDFDQWLQYESQNFITYWYGEGRNVGHSVVLMAEEDYNHILNVLEHRLNDKIEIIVYIDLTDLKQSNIGTEEVFVNTGGQTKIVGNKIFVYFNGDHNHLREQVREGVASVYLQSMLFGSNIQEIVQNAVMMNLPEWFKQGLVAFVAESWGENQDNRLRDVILSGLYKDFEDFAEEDPKLAGHSMWYYIQQNYGKSTVSNLLYLTRINRSIESGFLYVLGSSFQRISISWESFFEERYLEETKSMVSPDSLSGRIEFKNRRSLPITKLKLSPDGKRIAYVLNEIGKFKIYVQDIATGDRKVIFKSGVRNAFQATDYNYPLIAWKPNNQDLAILYERRDLVKYLVYSTTTNEIVEEEELAPVYQRVYNMDFIDNFNLVFSAAARGYSDIYIYKTKTRQTEALTRDYFDDLNASFVELAGRKGVLFSSNRPDSLLLPRRIDSLPAGGQFDLYFYELLPGGKKPDALTRVTRTEYANEWQSLQVDSAYFSFISDESGIFNRRSGYLQEELSHYLRYIYLEDGMEIVLHEDSTLESLDTALIDTVVLEPVYILKPYVHNNTNYSRNIELHDVAPRAGLITEYIPFEGESVIFVRPSNPQEKAEAVPTRFKLGYVMQQEQASVEAIAKDWGQDLQMSKVLEEEEEDLINISDIPVEKQDTGRIDIDNYLFQSEFDDEEPDEPAPAVEEISDEDGELQLQREEAPAEPAATAPKPQAQGYNFRPSRIIPYRLKFRTDYFTTQLDNSLLFGGLDSYFNSEEDREFRYPPPGILLKVNFKDLFEDFEIEGGARYPTTFNGTEYFVVADFKKKRLDRRVAFYRRSLRYNDDNDGLNPGKSKEIILLGQYQLRYPLDIFRSLRLTGTIREDRLIRLGTDRSNLELPNETSQRLIAKLEYVFDNTLQVDLNILNGTRYKVYTEIQKRFDLHLGADPSFNFGQGVMGVLGADFRHYQRLDKRSIFAVRAAGATSFGAENILFQMGGVDNWLFPSFESDFPRFGDRNYAFQALAVQMRGFNQNIRFGNSYALVNTELRVPIFRYLFPRVRSGFFRHFQLVGFFDAGTAWEGADPFSEDNPLNTDFFGRPENNPTVTVKVNYFRDPIVFGYGAGARLVLFGYFLKLDYAWGVETREVQDPILYFSIGTDF